MANRVYAYIRTSTVKQGTEGVSLDAQHDAITAYAFKHGLEVVEWFTETQTAAKRGRPVFSRMMKALHRRKVDGLILHRIDRGSRNLKDWSDIADLNDIGIRVHFAHDALDLGTRGGRLAADVQAVVAADFIRNLREETTKGMLGRLKQGYWPWAAPIGYLDCGKATPKAVDPVLAPVVKRAFELYATGLHNFQSLRAILFDLGLRSPGGGRLSLRGITTILRNPFYYGAMRVQKWGELFPGIHQPLISKELFDQVQAVIDGRLNRRTVKHNFLYRRDIRCATCRRSLLGETQKGRVYYRCHTRTCPKTSIREDRVAESLKRDLVALLQFCQVNPELSAILEQRLADAKRLLAARRSTLEGARATHLTRLSKATDALLDGTLDRASYLEKKNEIVAEVANVGEQLALQEKLEIVATPAAQFYLSFTSVLRKQVFCSGPASARAACRSVTSNFVASGKHVEMQWCKGMAPVIAYARALGSDPTSCTYRTLDQWAALLLDVEVDVVDSVSHMDEGCQRPHVPTSCGPDSG